MPKVFRFRLEGLLSLRRRAEDEAEQVAMQAAREQRLAEAALEAVVSRIAAHMEAGRQRREQGQLDLDAIRDEGGWSRQLEQERKAAEAELERRSQETERTRWAWVEARRAREVVSRLRERQHLAWQRDLDQAEQKLLDELATQGHARNARPGGEPDPL